MRILIAGAGALGSVFGGFLRRAGDEVALLGRAAHLDAVARDGLRIDGLWGEHVVRGFTVATEPAALRGPFNVILLPVKSYDTAAVAAAVAPLLASDGVMISVQNGLGNVETVEAAVGAERALGARVIFGATLPAPGHVRVTVFADPTAIGALAPGRYARRDALVRELAARIDAAGVPAVATDHLPAMLWAKVFYNAALNPLGALLDLHYGALPEHPESRDLMDAVIDEAFAVATAEGLSFKWPSAAAYRDEFYGRLVPSTYHHRSSMLQDLERGRRTEIDAINGAVWQRGRARGVAAPVNAALTRLLRVVEARRAA
ncbi:MAG TPA: ketopantoate reductase family protein [Candidatus Dormibacteraeota bacterium]|nr:ketopantoate reductase family protein [Candidatus Dormibacteraeota bacterium]